MRFTVLALSTLLSGSIMASSYDSKEIVSKNPEIAKRFNFLKKIELKNKVSLAIIGDYVHTDTFSHIININKSEINENYLDDDKNGFEDDYFGVNFNSRNGRLNSPVMTGHENAIASLIEAFLIDNQLSKIKIIPINITSDENRFDKLYVKKLADAVDYARIRGAQVISMSLGVDQRSDSFFRFIDNDLKKSRAYYQAALDRAVKDNILLVGTTSNDPARDLVKEPVVPGNSDNVIQVANVSFDGKVQSAYGQNVDLAFYGTGLYAWYGEKDGYRTVKGSSYSTPLVALTMAIGKSLKPTLSVKNINLMRAACEKPIIGKKNVISKCVFSPQKYIQSIN